MSNFKNLLNNKLKTNTTKDFDQKFWMKFNEEFNSNEWSFLRWLRENYLLIASTGATAALALVVVFKSPYLFTPKKDIVTAHEIMESQEMLTDLDMFSEFEGEVALHDDDWNDLLKEDLLKDTDDETEEAI